MWSLLLKSLLYLCDGLFGCLCCVGSGLCCVGSGLCCVGSGLCCVGLCW